MKPETGRKRITIAIVVWGFSIHAKRRITVFAEDPRFRVVIISNFRYEIPDAELFLLPSSNTACGCRVSTWVSGIIRRMNQGKKSFLLRAMVYGITRVHDVATECIGSIHDISSIRRIIAGCRPDLVLLQTLLYPAYLVFFARITVPVMITFWNGDVIWWAKYTFFEIICKKQIVREGILRAKALTVNSTSAFDACISMGKDRSDVHLIRYPGVDIDIFRPGSRSIAREKLHISSSHVILWPRGAGYFHNVQTLLEAVPGLVNRYPDILFILLQVIQSDNSMSPEISGWIAQNPQYRQNFLLSGSVPHEMMPDLYHASDMMISLSSNDSLPNSMLEAMASNIPLIMGDIPQIREWIADGENGYLIPVTSATALSDRIMQILESRDDEIERLVACNRIMIEREFDSRIIKERIKELAVLVSGR